MFVVRIVLIVIFLILSAIFSGTEIVYSKVNKLRLEREANKGDKKSKKALSLAQDFNKTITTVLISNNLVNIALTSFATLVATTIYYNHTGISELSSTWAIITTAIITFTVLIFGEILPKTIFPAFSYPLSRKLTGFISFLSYLFLPIIFVVNFLVNIFSKPFIKKNNDEVTEEETLDDELNAMTDELEESGEIDSDDAELIRSAIIFTEKVAVDIMVPRVDVVMYDIDDGLDKIIEDDRFYENSRVPVYKENVDNIVGIIDTSLVLKLILNKKQFTINDVLFDTLFVHKTMPLSDILIELRTKHMHLAVVLDEWGGFMGILTIEDILEVLFGEIWDETDVIELEYEQIDENHYTINGDMNIHDLFDLLDYDDRDFESEYTTVGGWCTEVLNRFPEVGDEFDFENYHITILQMDGIRVEKISLEIKPIEEEKE